MMADINQPVLDPASRVYLWIWGSMLLVLGVGSLVLHPDFGVGQDVTAKHLFGLFETNGWHGLAGGALGAVAVYSAWSGRWLRAVTLGVSMLGGIIPSFIFLGSGDDSVALRLIPVDAADAITLHMLPGLVGLACMALDAFGRARRTSAISTTGE